MKKVAIFSSLFFFFLMVGIVRGATLNFTTYNLTEIPIDTSTAHWIYDTKAIWDTNEQEWHLIYNGIIRIPYMCRFDDDFSTLMDGCDSMIPEANSINRGIDMYDYNRTHLMLISDDGQTGGDEEVYIHYIKKLDLSKTQFSKSADIDEGDKRDLKFSSNDNNSFVFFDHVGEHQFCFNNGTCAEIFVNSIHALPTDLQWVYVPDTDEYYMFYVQNETDGMTAKAYLNIYDASKDDEGLAGYQPDFKGWFQVSIGDIIPNEPTPACQQCWMGTAKAPQGSIFAKYINGFVYWSGRTRIASQGNSNQTYYFEAIDPVGTKEHSWLHLIKGSAEYINLTAYDSHLCEVQNWTEGACTNSSQGLSFEYVEEDDQWWFFYHRYNYSDTVSSSSDGYGYELMALTTASECRCSDWYNVSSCGDYISGKQKQMRSCNPNYCDDESQYIDCTEITPTIKYRLITKCVLCNPATKLPTTEPQQLYASKHGSADCQVYIDIPENVTNITSTAFWTIFARKRKLLGIDLTPDNNFTASICNPLVEGNCQEESKSCKNDYNHTFSLDYDSYTPGQQASADFTISGLTACHSGGWGWDEYFMSGDLCVYWSRVCGGYHCKRIGTKWYEELEDAECNPINSTYCGDRIHCDFDTGRCEVAGIPPSVLEGDPFDVVRSMTESTFSSWVLVLISVGMTGGVTVYTGQLVKNWQIALSIGALIGLVFLIMGWLPPIIGILWILTVAVILMKGMFFKGD